MASESGDDEPVAFGDDLETEAAKIWESTDRSRGDAETSTSERRGRARAPSPAERRAARGDTLRDEISQMRLGSDAANPSSSKFATQRMSRAAFNGGNAGIAPANAANDGPAEAGDGDPARCDGQPPPRTTSGGIPPAPPSSERGRARHVEAAAADKRASLGDTMRQELAQMRLGVEAEGACPEGPRAATRTPR
eukprot:TRINITY_DN12213_c0_g1_i1.p2 TRINITY_DN12213_c0_g1~~TRINITY_DN12213_c0_g1_i1.p2  ORF type:complete len:211 (-),score=38.05 TRINITY_DN12213_c0_g1_i1:58-639(-)